MTKVERHKSDRLGAMNLLFALFVGGAISTAAFNDRLAGVTAASFDQAKAAVELALGLVGIMAFWLGMMRVLEAGGCMNALARGLRPVMVRLFPGVPAEHPAMSAMILNIAANMLGLGNAATPFGLRAMEELNRLNTRPGTASNAMCLFLALNTSGVALLPLGVIGVRAAAGATDPAAILVPTLLATMVSTLVAVTACLLIARRSAVDTEAISNSTEVKQEVVGGDDYQALRFQTSWISRLMGWGLLAFFMGGLIAKLALSARPLEFVQSTILAHWLLPALILLIVSFGLIKGVKLYEAVTAGAKQGFEIAIRIIPFMVAILVAIGMFRASGAMDYLAVFVNPITSLIGMPADVLPMAIIRPLSGSGAFGVMSALVSNAPDSYSAFVASVMMGSTETTFYVLAVYFGSVGIVRVRYALAAALLADVSGIIAACLLSLVFY